MSGCFFLKHGVDCLSTIAPAPHVGLPSLAASMLKALFNSMRNHNVRICWRRGVMRCLNKHHDFIYNKHR